MMVEGRTPVELKSAPNHHYSSEFLEPWGARSHRGYGIEILQRFFEEVGFVEFGGPRTDRARRWEQMRALAYNDLSADRNTVAVIQALEAILAHHAQGQPGSIVEVNGTGGGLALSVPGRNDRDVLYVHRV